MHTYSDHILIIVRQQSKYSLLLKKIQSININWLHELNLWFEELFARLKGHTQHPDFGSGTGTHNVRYGIPDTGIG